MCSHENRLIETILMNTHNITYQYKKENHPKISHIESIHIPSAAMELFVRDSRTSSK